MRQRALIGNGGEKAVDVTGIVVALGRVYLGRLGVEANFEGHRRLQAVADGGEAQLARLTRTEIARSESLDGAVLRTTEGQKRREELRAGAAEKRVDGSRRLVDSVAAMSM